MIDSNICEDFAVGITNDGSELFMEFILEILFDIYIELVTYGGQEELEKQRF